MTSNSPSGITNRSSRISASFKILKSDVVPSHPARTYVNFMSKSQAAKTFCVVQSFLPQKREAYDRGTLTLT